jgi:poly(A) polymerase Pap1
LPPLSAPAAQELEQSRKLRRELVPYDVYEPADAKAHRTRVLHDLGDMVRDWVKDVLLKQVRPLRLAFPFLAQSASSCQF